MADRLRILILGQLESGTTQSLQSALGSAEVVQVDDLSQGLTLLKHQSFDLVVLQPGVSEIRERVEKLLQSERLLDTLADGIAIVNLNLEIQWANRTFEKWCNNKPVKGRWFYEALGTPDDLNPEECPFRIGLVGETAFTRFHSRDNHVFELHISPIHNKSRSITQLLALCRDVTAEVHHQQRLDAIHKAGRDLATLESDNLSDLSVEERIVLLKQKITTITHDLLHYDVIEIRLLDRQTQKLEPLITEGMPVEASDRRLRAGTENNGVTGYVAATGKTYVCSDTASDPRYIEGSSGARSSVTVPLIYQEEVIGTLNVESPNLDAFSREDVQFIEIFSREIATALHTLELLSMEKQGATSRALEAVNREVALPVDEIIAASSAILDRYIGHDKELAEQLHTVLSNARNIKQSIQKVGEDLAPDSPLAVDSKIAAVPETFKGLRVLVVDSDKRVRRSAHGILGRWGCVVETARDGREAITMARLGNYGAILSDIRLPDLSGYEAYSQLRQAQPDARVILMTNYGYDPSHSLVKARQDGLKHVLFKPFRVDQLRDALPLVNKDQPETNSD